jgi:hypothetical protein
MKTNISKRTYAMLLTGGIVGCVILGLGVGAAVAQVPAIAAPTGLTSADGSLSTPAPSPKYPTNSSGLSYGSSLRAVSPQTEPDLIAAVATNGRTGYVKKADLSSAEGPTDFASPQEALAWQSANAGKATVLHVFEKDGITTIGEFIIHHPTATERAGLNSE